MTVKTKVRNRKSGVSVEVNINNKSEANNQSKNRYIPQLQSNTDDPEPPSQTSIQNIIPYFNKAPSLPMYNAEGLGIPSRYGNLAPQGNTSIPAEYDADEVGQELGQKINTDEPIQVERPSQNLDSEITDSGPMDFSDLQQQEVEQGGNVPLPDIAENDWPPNLIERFKKKNEKEQEKFIIFHNGYKRRLSQSFTDISKTLSSNLLTKYGLWGMLERAYRNNELSSESSEYYERLLRKKFGLNF